MNEIESAELNRHPRDIDAVLAYAAEQKSGAVAMDYVRHAIPWTNSGLTEERQRAYVLAVCEHLVSEGRMIRRDNGQEGRWLRIKYGVPGIVMDFPTAEQSRENRRRQAAKTA